MEPQAVGATKGGGVMMRLIHRLDRAVRLVGRSMVLVAVFAWLGIAFGKAIWRGARRGAA